MYEETLTSCSVLRSTKSHHTSKERYTSLEDHRHHDVHPRSCLARRSWYVLPEFSEQAKLTLHLARSEDSSVEKRAPAPALDGVNLNIADGQVTELTFVETKEVDDATEE